MKRYLFVGSVEFSGSCLTALLKMDINIVGIMCPEKEAAKINNDYFDLGITAREFGKEVKYIKKIKDEIGFIKEKRPDIIFVLGLSQIIPGQVLDIPTIGCIGSHPALLPQNRGRHPIIWAIANGLKKSAITLFWIDEGIDSGDIWDQREFDISDADDAASIYEKVKRLSVEMLKENIYDLEQGIINRTKQDDSQANYWRKRTSKDGEIDWRMSSKRIYDLVRALTTPYVGAHSLYKGREYTIWKVEIFDQAEETQNIEPGKVLKVKNNGFCVKTGDGCVWVINHDLGTIPIIGEYLSLEE
jgi:methionyl-tRNA formyltransferase